MSDFPINGSNQNNVQNNYEYDKNSLIAELNGLNTTIENMDDIEEADEREEQLNPPQVVNELTDVPVLSDALVSKNKALQLFRSPLETHDTFERTLQRKHKFNFFEKFLCVISFGLASPLINHLNKSNDRKEAMELKNNTLAVNYALANFPKGEHSNSVNVDLFNDGKVIHAQIERNEKNQLFIKLPHMEQKIRLPYDLQQMKTLISTDICSHIDIFGLESALISLDAENKDINRRGMLTNILSHMTGGEKKYDELSVMDFNSLESIVRDIRNNSETLRESGSSDADIFQSNRTFLENELKKVEAKHQLIATKLNSSLVQKEALYNESIAKIEDQIYQSNLNKLNLELNAQKTKKESLDKTISEKSSAIASYLEKKDLPPEELQAKRGFEFELETATKNRTLVADKIAELVKRIDDLNEEHENLLAQRVQNAQDNPVALNNQVMPVSLGEAGKHSQKINSIYVNSIIEKLETEKKEAPQNVSQKVNTSVILNGTDNKFIKQKEVLQNKIELVKGYGTENAKKYTDGLRSLKENSQNKLKNFYTADFLASKIIGLNSAFNHNHILKAEYEDKLYKLESEIDKLKTSQDPVDQETLKHLNTELNNLKKNPTYLSDEKLIKNMVLENKEIFAAINAEINKIMQETKSTNPESAFRNTSIGKIINSEVGDIVCSLCREIGFDKITAGDIDSSLTAFDMKNSITGFFSSIGSFFWGGDAPKAEEKKTVDPFFVKVSRIPNAISSMSVVKLQNLTEELSIALSSKKFTYEQFKELKAKYISVISFFENPGLRIFSWVLTSPIDNL